MLERQFSQALLKGLLVCLLILSVTNIATPIFAKEDSTESAKVTAQQPESHYLLAYPGMLPDSPLYKLKVLRDKIATFLISDPLKKIDFYLLRADKGILASSMLLDKNETALAKETALKAENNITELVRQLSSLPQKPESSLFERLMLASRTHQAIFEQMIKKTKGDDKKTFQDVLYFSKSNLETIKKLSKKNPSQWQDQTQ